MIGDVWQCLGKTRVLDLTEAAGYMCGKMLADLGADVIKVEPPRGHEVSTAAHLFGEHAGPEKDLHWFAYNAGKRCITLNLEAQEGIEIFRRLVKKSHILVESFPPGLMARWGLDHEDLRKLNPAMVYTSIRPFGRSGPFKEHPVTDLVAMATGGPLFLTGDADRAPVQTGYPQAYLHAGAEACVGTLIALYEAEATGEGQLVDVSVQESLLTSNFNAVYTWVTEQVLVTRMGSSRMVGKQLEMPLTWPCKDGYVNFAVLGGASGGKTMKNLAQWMEEEGMGNETVVGTDWGAFDFYGLTTEIVEKVVKPITRFFAQHTKEELFEESLKRGIMLFPAADAEGTLADPHLEEKGFWQPMRIPSEKNQTIAFPRPPFRINEKYPSLKGWAPHLGEHNLEVYGEILGLSAEDLTALEKKGVL
jgi:crotonobetainyl-CoA:carnitine CoA-transferase CaiB-like acyl-CoA transferase